MKKALLYFNLMLFAFGCAKQQSPFTGKHNPPPVRDSVTFTVSVSRGHSALDSIKFNGRIIRLSTSTNQYKVPAHVVDVLTTYITSTNTNYWPRVLVIYPSGISGNYMFNSTPNPVDSMVFANVISDSLTQVNLINE